MAGVKKPDDRKVLYSARTNNERVAAWSGRDSKGSVH